MDAPYVSKDCRDSLVFGGGLEEELQVHEVETELPAEGRVEGELGCDLDNRGEGLKDEEGTSDGTGPSRTTTSMYAKLFEGMVAAVANYELHLFSVEERACLKRYFGLSYNAQYLLVRLLLRRSEKWHRLSALKYQSELGETAAIENAVRELCHCPDDDAPMKKEDVSIKTEPEVEMIDLSMDDDDVDIKPEPEAVPSCSAFAPGSPQAQNVELDLTVFCEDDTCMTLSALLDCLMLEELKALCRQLKLKTAGSRSSMISSLLSSAVSQSTLHHFIVDSSCQGKGKGKQKAIDKSLIQTRLNFPRTIEKGKVVTQEGRLREMVMHILKKCVRIRSDIFRLFRRINLVYLRNTEYTPTILTPCLLSRARKRYYPIYAWKRTPDIWRTREDLLAYEEALEIETEVDAILGGMQGAGTALKKKAKARSASASSRTPAVDTVKEKAKTSSTPVRSVPVVGDANQNKENVPGDKEIEDAVEEAESPRVVDARAVKKIFESVYQRWQDLVREKNESDEGGRPKGLERFDCGYVLTRIVCKGTYALGVLKEYEYEVAVLSALLEQRRWRRGRRGRWHDRRALVLITHLPKTMETWWRALHFVVAALEDEDTHIIYRPMLERRLTRLEKRLKLPADECHTSEAVLQQSADVYIEGQRILNRASSLTLDSIGRPTGNEQTPVQDDGTLPFKVITPIGVKSDKVPSLAKDKSSVAQGQQQKVWTDRWKGKTVWKGEDDNEVNVETLALEYYVKKGYKGFHCEGRIVTTIFGLIFWDVLFAPIAGAFETPYQSAPLDIAEDSFFHARRELIEKRLEEIAEGQAGEILGRVDGHHREKKTWCVGVRWDLFEKEDLAEIVQCLGARPLSIICRLFCEDYSARSSGLPDLCIWDATRGECKFVEVKGPGDSLQENQKLWIDVLLRAGVPVEICHVAELGQTKIPQPKTPKAKKAPAKNPKPRKASAVTDQEPGCKVDDAPGAPSGSGMKRKMEDSDEDTSKLPATAVSHTRTVRQLGDRPFPLVNRAEVVLLSPRKKTKTEGE